MLAVRIPADALFEHDPAVKIDVRALLRHGKGQGEIVLVGLVHGVDPVAGPLVVDRHLAGDHIRLAGVCLKGEDIVLDSLEPLFHLRDHLRGSVIHLLLQLLRVIGIAAEFLRGQHVGLDGCDRGKIGFAHAVLDRHPPAEGRVRQDLPGGCLLLCHHFGIVDQTRDAPHITGRVPGPGLPVDLLGLKHVPDEGGHAA